jgi:putative transcriptional regulator
LGTIKTLLNADPETKNNVRFFLGYSGWEAGQLDNELEINSWVVSNISKAEVFQNDYRNMWKNKVRSMGKDYRYWINFPVNPIDN